MDELELLVVVPRSWGEKEIKERLDAPLDMVAHHWYGYAGNLDVLYRIREKDADRAESVLKGVAGVVSWNFSEVEDEEGA